MWEKASEKKNLPSNGFACLLGQEQKKNWNENINGGKKILYELVEAWTCLSSIEVD